jgi:hypothetical protein
MGINENNVTLFMYYMGGKKERKKKIDCTYCGCCGHDHMVVVFTITYATSAYHH